MNKMRRFESLKKLPKIFAVICCLLAFSGIVLADQFAWISKDQAENALEILKKQKQIKHFCAPCNDKTIETENIETVRIVRLKENYWQVEVNGKGIDLAYVYFKTKKGKWKNLALEMNLDAEDVPEYLAREGKGKNKQ